MCGYIEVSLPKDFFAKYGRFPLKHRLYIYRVYTYTCHALATGT